MICVTSPGLPARPKLLFDPDKRRAMITARHTTWQSHEWAIIATRLITLLVICLAAWFVWSRLPGQRAGEKAVICLFLLVVIVPFVRVALGISLHGFLARQVFPCRTSVWVTPDAVAFRSHLYERPVTIWRRWKGRPVGVRFIVLPNRNATSYKYGLDFKKSRSRGHLDNAKMLAMVINSTNERWNVNLDGHDGSLRTLPMTDIDADDAERFTMVYAAALTMTAAEKEASPRAASVGTDIETT